MSEAKETHVDDFVTDFSMDKKLTYAKWFLFLKRLPAVEQAHFSDYIEPYKLFATWKSGMGRFRVTGASRLGDVWITPDFAQDTGYKHRVSIDDLFDFSETP